MAARRYPARKDVRANQHQISASGARLHRASQPPRDAEATLTCGNGRSATPSDETGTHGMPATATPAVSRHGFGAGAGDAAFTRSLRLTSVSKTAAAPLCPDAAG